MLKGGMSQLVSEPYEYSMTLTAIFSKTYGEDMLQCSYKDYSNFDKWQANRDLLSVFTFCNLLFVTTHLSQGKYPSTWWCESWTRCLKVRFTWCSPYRMVGATVRRAMSHDRIPRLSRDLGMSCGHFRKTWIRSCDICSAVHAALNAWVPFGG
jgi:hypothetical protein